MTTLTLIALPAICQFSPAGELEICTPPPLEDMQIWLSWYDPKLCLPEHGGHQINCDDNPGFMAGGTPVTEDMYGKTAACLPQWFGKTITVDFAGERICLDTGGDIKPTYKLVYTKDGFKWMWVIVTDILAHYEDPPEWEYELVNWSLN